MTLVQIQCPNCGSHMEASELSLIKNVKVECPSCHSTFIWEALHSDIGANSEFYKEQIETELHKEKILSQIKNDEKIQQQKIDQKELKILGIIMLVLLSLFPLWEVTSKIRDSISHTTTVYLPESAKSLKGEDYKLVKDQLTDSGFTHIKLEKLKDLKIGWIVKDGEVEKVMINGEADFEKDDSFRSNAKVKIYYHTFKDKKE